MVGTDPLDGRAVAVARHRAGEPCGVVRRRPGPVPGGGERDHECASPDGALVVDIRDVRDDHVAIADRHLVALLAKPGEVGATTDQ